MKAVRYHAGLLQQVFPVGLVADGGAFVSTTTPGPWPTWPPSTTRPPDGWPARPS